MLDDFLNKNSPENELTSHLPSWLRRKLPSCSTFWQTRQILAKTCVKTVCEEAKCPNLLECFSKKTATFLVLGKECTRCCGFCDIKYNPHPPAYDDAEGIKIALAVQKLQLKHVVITMVTRDDLADGGAKALLKILKITREKNPAITLEVLCSDFQGNKDSLDTILESGIDLFNHNLETVRELTPKIRHKASYERSLEVLSYVKKHSPLLVKSGIMVGLGETTEQVKNTLNDLNNIGCDIVTIGQYLQASPQNLRVKEYILPEQFIEYKEYGEKIGLKFVYSSPFVRSSYNASLIQKP